MFFKSILAGLSECSHIICLHHVSCPYFVSTFHGSPFVLVNDSLLAVFLCHLIKYFEEQENSIFIKIELKTCHAYVKSFFSYNSESWLSYEMLESTIDSNCSDDGLMIDIFIMLIDCTELQLDH